MSWGHITEVPPEVSQVPVELSRRDIRQWRTQEFFFFGGGEFIKVRW
jgi:hypothetical protein